MSFRASELLERRELTRIQLDKPIELPVNDQHQDKNGYQFTINDRSSFFDWYNAYFEVNFQLQKRADGAGYAAADMISVINGSHSLIYGMTIKSAGKVIYDNHDLHKVTFLKNLMEFSNMGMEHFSQKLNMTKTSN